MSDESGRVGPTGIGSHVAEVLEEYEVDEPIPHTRLLSAADAAKYGDRVRKKIRTPANKAAKPTNK
jgi:hypothetical protein